MRIRYEVIIKKDKRKVHLPINEIWLEDDGAIFPVPSTFSVSRPVYGFIAKNDAQFEHALKKLYPDVCGYENL
jgi:hypothetical protein